MTDCRRCDWRSIAEAAASPREQLVEHAVEAVHPLCVVCARSLAATEIQSCTQCVADVRRRLDGIVDLFAMLPSTMGHPASPRYDADDTSSSKDRPLPGGDALVMLAGGGRGVGLATDPPAVAFELGQWEDDWRHVRREPAAAYDATVVTAVGYLSDRAGWAGSHHPAFDEFAQDVRRIHHRLEVATAMDDRPQRGAPCFECGADLLRRNGEEHFSCPRCRRDYDPASYWLAVRAQVESERDRG